ncbi:MAG TPA: branched-chain amino acid ABC transporter permease [Magnetospirillaceae bacterium]
MAGLLQLLSSGLATGAIYALAATGFTLLWQASATVNFAQGEFVMLPAFFVLASMQLLGLSFGWSIVVGVALSIVVLGLLFKRLLVDPLSRYGFMPLVIATIALGLFIKEAVKTSFSAEALPFPALVPPIPVHMGDVTLSLQDISIFVFAVIAVAALQLFLTRTRTGRTMQATAQNRALAVILGVPVSRMILYTFLLNAALVSLASILVSPIYLAKFSNGESLGLIAFTAAIVGGFNQVRGAILGGFVVGIADNLTAAYISTEYRSALPLVLLIAIILFRPQGLLGRSEERTV